MFVAETITSTLNITQDGGVTVTPISNSELHIKPADVNGLEIYVSLDESARDFCIAEKLPRQFAACLMKCKPSRVNPKAVTVVASIIHAKPTNTSRILETNGIVELDLPPYDEGGDEPIPNQRVTARSGRSRPVTQAASPSRPIDGDSPFSAASKPPGSPSPSHSEQFFGMLVHVVKTARNMPFPDYAPIFDLSVIPQSLQGSSPGQNRFKLFVGDQEEWRHMVGAAGELFVSRTTSPNNYLFHFSNYRSGGLRASFLPRSKIA